MKNISASILLFFATLSPLSFAADPGIYSHKKHGAIRGADVVAYYSLEAGDNAIRGDKNISHEYKGATWYFSSVENRDLFAANPENYAPQYGGYCAFAVSHNFTKPIDPDKWHIIEGKLYLNYNWIADRKWRKDSTAAIERGNANWPTVLTTCEEHNNCGG